MNDGDSLEGTTCGIALLGCGRLPFIKTVLVLASESVVGITIINGDFSWLTSGMSELYVPLSLDLSLLLFDFGLNVSVASKKYICIMYIVY